MCGLVIYTVVDEESDLQLTIAQFRRPDVKNRGSRFLIVGFLIVCLHRMAKTTRCHEAPRASVYHGVVSFGDFRSQKDYDDGIPGFCFFTLKILFAPPARRF